MSFEKGLFKDSDPQQQPPGTYRDALNLEFNRQRTSLVSEQGTELADTLPTGQKLIGSVVLDDDRVVLFTAIANPPISPADENDCAIYIYTPSTGNAIVHTVGGNSTESPYPGPPIASNSFAKLNFRPDKPIQATFRVNGEGEYEIYWTDGFNPPRYLNLSDPLIDPTSLLDGYKSSSLNLFTPIKFLPVFQLRDVKEGLGNLRTGTYQFAFAYVTKNDYSQTNWLYATNPVSVVSSMDGSLPYVGDPVNTETGVGIRFDLENIDTDYYAVRVAVIKDGVNVSILPDIPVSVVTTGGSIPYTYTGNESWIPGDLTEIEVDKAIFKTAGTLAQVDGHLHLGNLTKQLDIGYQKYANNIKVEARPIDEPLDWADRKIATPPTRAGSLSFPLWRYGDPWYNYLGKSFKRGEVYALYISFILKDGVETKAYHIPGRIVDTVSGEQDHVLADIGDGMRDKLGDHWDYQVNSRKSEVLVPGTPDVDSLGYWQNEHEEYGDTEDWKIFDLNVNGDPSDTGTTVKSINLKADGVTPIPNVRHHRMPENVQQDGNNEALATDSQYWAKILTGIPDLPTWSKSVPLYLRLVDVKFPNTITNTANGATYKKEDVLGYKIYHAEKRPDNQLILDSCSLMNGALSSTTTPTERHAQNNTVWDGSNVLVPHGLPSNFAITGNSEGKTVLSSRIFYGRPGHSLKERMPVGGLTFIKHVFTYEQSLVIVDPYEVNYGPGEHYKFQDVSYQPLGTNYPLKAAAYAEKNLETLQLDELGLSYSMNNRYGESKVVLEVETPGTPATYGPPGTKTNGYAEGTFTYDAGTTGSLTVLTVNGVSIITGTEAFGGSIQAWITNIADNINTTVSVPNYSATSYSGKLRITADTIGVGPNGFVVADTVTGDLVTNVTPMAGGGTDVNPNDMRKWQADLCQFKEDVHLRFQDQELVWTGYLNTSLDEETSWENPIAGDVFLCPHIYNAVTLFDIFSTSTTGSYFTDALPSGQAFDAYANIFADWATWVETKPFIDNSIYKELSTNRITGAPREGLPTVWDDEPENSLSGRPLPIGYPVFEFTETRTNLNYRHKGSASFEDWTNGARNKGQGEKRFFPMYKNVTIPDITRFEADTSETIRDLNLSVSLEEIDQTDFIGFNPDRIRNDNLLSAARSGMAFKWPSQFWSQWMGWYDYADNWIFINDAYSRPNKVKIAIPYDITRPDTTDFSTRIARSQKISPNDAVGTWRTYLPNDYFDFSRHKGDIIRLSTFQNNLIVHFEKTLMMMGARHEIKVGEDRAWLGAGDIFNTAPSEILDVTGGYGGLQDLLGAATTPFGYAFIDRRKGKAFLYNGQLNEISLNGVRNYLLENIDAVTGQIRVGFADDYNRIMFTHTTTNQTLGSDFTISHLPELNVWESFHSYLPDHYVVGSAQFFTSKNDNLYEHGKGRVGYYYNANYPCTLQVVANDSPELEKQVATLNLDTKIIDEFNQEVRRTFDTFQITNHQQDTGLIYTSADNDDLLFDNLGATLPSAGARETQGYWRINQFRDLSHINAGSQMPEWIQKRRLSGQYHIIDLSFTNIGQRELTVHNVWLDYRRSLR